MMNGLFSIPCGLGLLMVGLGLFYLGPRGVAWRLYECVADTSRCLGVWFLFLLCELKHVDLICH